MGKRQDWIIIQRLGDIVLSRVSGAVFEVGIGKSTEMLKKIADDFGREMYSFDMHSSRCSWAEGIGCNVIRGKTKTTLNSFLNSFPDIAVALGLIDGRHDSITARMEVRFFLELLTPGGMIFMHDTSMPTDRKIREESHPRGPAGDVYKVRQELEIRRDIQTFTWPYTAMNQGLTMFMKLENNRCFSRA